MGDKYVLKKNFDVIQNNLHRQVDLNIELQAERDRWKRRAEALELIVKANFPCLTCFYHNKSSGQMVCKNCSESENKKHWQFDEMRFAKGGDEA